MKNLLILFFVLLPSAVLVWFFYICGLIKTLLGLCAIVLLAAVVLAFKSWFSQQTNEEKEAEKREHT